MDDDLVAGCNWAVIHIHLALGWCPRLALPVQRFSRRKETLPGFVWLNVHSVILGAVYMFAFAWVFGSYFVWMHNTSLVKTETEATITVSPRKTA